MNSVIGKRKTRQMDEMIESWFSTRKAFPTSTSSWPVDGIDGASWTVRDGGRQVDGTEIVIRWGMIQSRCCRPSLLSLWWCLLLLLLMLDQRIVDGQRIGHTGDASGCRCGGRGRLKPRIRRRRCRRWRTRRRRWRHRMVTDSLDDTQAGRPDFTN